MFNFGKVVFDPGHGSKINAGPNGYYEGDAMLKLGLLLKAKGFELTKEDGSDPDLLTRVQKAKKLGANTIISLHTDWVPPNDPKSTEQTMVIYSLNRPGDKEIAEYLAKEIAAAIGVSRTKTWTRHASYSTPEKPVDYYGILRHGVNLGIEHVFIVEHCNHAQMSVDTDIKLQKIADCYERIFRGNSQIFNDYDIVSPWAKDAVKKVKEAGIMIGDKEGNFNPHKPITREEMAVIIDKLIKREGKS